MAEDICKKIEIISLKDNNTQEGDNDSGVDEFPHPEPVPAGRVKRSLSIASSRSIRRPDVKPQKVPMNKIKVGLAPSPDLSSVRSRIKSLEKANHKPGGGNVQIPIQKIAFEAKPRIAARNDNYIRGGGEKKIHTLRLQWDAKPKIGSLDNAVHKPGGGQVKIQNRKLDFKEKAQSKVGSTVNMKHVPGGGNVKIFDDKDYLRKRKDSGVGQSSFNESFDAASGTQSPDECV